MEKKESNIMWKLVAGFFCIIIFFTVFSRTVHNAATATVTLTTPKAGSISHLVYGNGTVAAKEETPVVLPEGLLVEQFYCSEGGIVEGGEPLLKIAADSLSEKMSEYSDNIEILELQNQELRSQQQAAVEQEKRNYQKASEDYTNTVASQQALADRAYAALEARTQELAAWQEQHSTEEENYEEELSVRQEAVNEAQEEYETVLSTQAESVASAKRAMEESALSGVVSSTQTKQNDIAIAQYLDKLAQLEGYQQKEGIIYAGTDGYISKIKMEAGEITAGGTVLMIANTSQQTEITAEFEKSTEQYLNTGNSVWVVTDDEESGQNLEGLVIKSVSEKAGDPDLLEVTVELPEGALSIGSNVQLEVKAETKSYESCIDKTVLHQSGENEYYVYVVEQEDTVLGKEYIATQVQVELLDSNETTAAVEGIFEGQDIVMESSRELDNKNPVKVRE